MSIHNSRSNSGWNISIWHRTESVLRLAGMTTALQETFELFKVIAQGPCNLSLNFPPAPRRNSVEGSDCRKNGQDIRQTSMFKAQIMDLQFYQTFSCAAVHFGDVPSECIAGVVRHDQTSFHEKQSDVAPHAGNPTIFPYIK